MPQPATIDDVITQLNSIIAWSKEHKSRAGYFAVLYRNTTVAVQDAIKQNRFEDGARMEKLDVVFANLYLNAWQAYTHNNAISRSWQATFDACANPKLTVVQHLLLGMNTHINLDLAIAASTISEGADITALQKDFEKINDVLATLTKGFYDRLCAIWFPLRALGRITNNVHDAVINFSMVKARQASWANAVALYACTGTARENYIRTIDNGVVTIANRIINRGTYLNFLLNTVRLMENREVVKLIDLLESPPKGILIQ